MGSSLVCPRSMGSEVASGVDFALVAGGMREHGLSPHAHLRINAKFGFESLLLRCPFPGLHSMSYFSVLVQL